MEQILDPAVIGKAKAIFEIIGMAVVGIPLILRGMELILLAIPGEQFGEKLLGKLRIGSEKLAEMLSKLLPKTKAPEELK